MFVYVLDELRRAAVARRHVHLLDVGRRDHLLKHALADVEEPREAELGAVEEDLADDAAVQRRLAHVARVEELEKCAAGGGGAGEG